MGKNKAILIHLRYKGKVPSDYIRLNEGWFTHYASITDSSGLQPESFDEIRTFGLLEKAYPLRDHLKKLDYLLAPGGSLVIDYYTAAFVFIAGHFIRPLSFLMYDISLSFGKRYKLISKKTEGILTELVYQKQKAVLSNDDSITKWSFGIVSDGQKDERIEKIIKQVQAFNIPSYEILICGPTPKFSYGADVKVLSDADLYHDIRIPITSKKNRIINSAAYNNLILMHDRITFPEDWYKRMAKYGNYFEILTNRILDEDTHTSRVQDWMMYKDDFDDYTNKNIGYIPYEKWHPSIYVDGGFMIAKRDLLKSINGFNEALHWGEAEDVDLSARLYQAGYMTNIDIANTVFTQTHRHKGVNENYFSKQIAGIKKTAKDIMHKQRLKKQNEEFIRFINEFSLDFKNENKTSE